MRCKRCASDYLKDLAGELAIHFPGLEGLNKPLVLVHPKLTVCLNCGFVEFVLPDEQKEQLKRGVAPTESQARARKHPREEQLQ